jgi:HPt (histidine-containing phosphotransfer) domain-containing protein
VARLDELAEADRRGDAAGVRAAAHTLRGMAANVGLTALAAAAADIEEAPAAAGTDGSRADALRARFRRGLDRLRAPG